MSICPSRHSRVMVIKTSDLADVLRGMKRICNLPTDADVIAAIPLVGGRDIGLRVQSLQYTSVEVGIPLPMVTPWFEKKPS